MRRSPDEGAAWEGAGVEVVSRVAGAGLGDGKVLEVLLLFMAGTIWACGAGVVAGGRASDVG